MDPQRQRTQEEQALPCHFQPILRAPCASKVKSFLQVFGTMPPLGLHSQHGLSLRASLSPVHCNPSLNSDTFISLCSIIIADAVSSPSESMLLKGWGLSGDSSITGRNQKMPLEDGKGGVEGRPSGKGHSKKL